MDPHARPEQDHGEGRLTENSLRYASKKHWSQITSQLREIYTAPGIGAAEVSFEAFAEDWEPIYPAMVKAWRDAWDDFEPFLEFPSSSAPSCTRPTRSSL